jgi:predicted Zn-ribbon and HTH transcriptional regulator
MTMDEEAVRALVRQAVARQLQGVPTPGASEPRPVAFASHVSHVRYALPETDGPCLIEPAVRCNHCGYCQSHGH